MADKSRRVYEAARGWLEIEIRGEHSERLLNLALQQGVELRRIQRLGQHKLRCRLLLAELYQLRPLLTATHCSLRILKRGGSPFWLYRCRRRLGLIAGSILFALALYAMCCFVWRVEVESIYAIDAAEHERISALAREAGLLPGVWAPGLDLAAINQYIMTAAGDLVFSYIERDGVTMLIHIVRRVDVKGQEQQPPAGDIVAACDGLIEQILVRNGTAAVQPGATVKAGDVLVYGYNGGQLVTASALIEARIWGQAIGSWPLAERGLLPSGQQYKSLWLRFNTDTGAPHDTVVLLSGTREAPFAQFTHKAQVYKALLWRNMPLPVELILDVWYEQQPYATSYSREQALSHAEQQAAALAMAQLPGECDLLRQTAVELAGDSDDAVYVQVVYEARADIGGFIPLSEERRLLYQEMLAQSAINNEP